MGFGLLFLGMSLILAMTAYGVLPSFIGCFVCMYACLKLADYEDLFRRSAWAFGATGSILMANSVLQLVLITGKNTLLSDFSENLQPFIEAVIYLCMLFLLPALAAIAKETGRMRTYRACRRNMVLLLLMFLLYIAANVLISLNWAYSRYCLLYLTLSRFAVLIFTMVQVFACYMWICREGEEEEEREGAESRLNERVTRVFKKKKEEEPVVEEVPKWIKDKRKRKK